ncbi:unnamed protein product [Brassica rapa]|uniref:Retrotransposon gag domain-containing protein n=1 Tax=Brassica campestris TaxID=3711 RepID=A0A8D9MBL5_BRACM|nr:unnamed protein product [Brassica rapa]
MFIPRFFYGGNCPETYLSWTANVETCIWHNHIPKNERLSLVASRLGGEARRWWEREEEKRWFHNRPAITTWEKLQNIMDKRYIPKDFPEAVKKQYGRRPTRKKVPSSASQLKLSKAISDSEGKANPPADLKKASLKLKEKHGDQVMNEFDQLEGLDLRTNTFKGGRDDLILRSSKYKDKKRKATGLVDGHIGLLELVFGLDFDENIEQEK